MQSAFVWYTNDMRIQKNRGMAANLAQLRQLGAEIKILNVGLHGFESSSVNLLYFYFMSEETEDEVYSVKKVKSFNPFKTKIPNIYSQEENGNQPLLYHQIGNRNFFLFSLQISKTLFCVDKTKY